MNGDDLFWQEVRREAEEGNRVIVATSRPPKAEQLDLVIPGARRSDPETSLAAANSMLEGAADHRAKILAVLADGIARTYVEIADVCGLDPVAVARRLSELHRLGAIRRRAETRLTPTGRPAHLWEAA